MKQFVKSLPKNGDTFKYLASKFPWLLESTLKESIFNDPNIRKLIKNIIFENKMENIKRAAWTSFKEVVKKFLGNHKDPDFKNIVEIMLKIFRLWLLDELKAPLSQLSS